MTAENTVEEKVYPVPSRLLDGSVVKPYVSSFEEYKAMWTESVENPTKFFGNVRYFYMCYILKMW
jgi:acetyl-CoA synthetase